MDHTAELNFLYTRRARLQINIKELEAQILSTTDASVHMLRVEHEETWYAYYTLVDYIAKLEEEQKPQKSFWKKLFRK